jgi:hypothetical protein
MVKGKRQKGFPFGNYIVCPFVVFLWPLYCLSFYRFPLTIILFVVCHFPLTILLFVLLLFSFDHYIVCPFVYNGQRKMTKGQTI